MSSFLATVLIADPILVLAAWGTTALVAASADGAVASNPYIGIRTRYTRSDPDVWREVHERAVKPLKVTAVAVTCFAVLALVFAANEQIGKAVLLLCAFSLALGVIASSLWAITTTKRRRQAE